jgi:hypothetical protein
MRQFGRMAVAATILMGFGATNASAGLIGSTVDVQADFPDVNTPDPDFGTQVITNGLSLTDGTTRVTFSDTQITFTLLVSTQGGTFAPTSFNGWQIALISGPAFTNATEDPLSTPSFSTGSVLSFTSSQILLNEAGTCSNCQGGESIIVDVTTAPVTTPEPISTSVIGVGLAALGLVRRRVSKRPE